MIEEERFQSTPTDDLVVADESAPLGRRIEALQRIGHDQLKSREPIVAPLLDHSDPLLRGAAAYVLVGLWRMVRHLDRALAMLEADDDSSGGALAAVDLLLHLPYDAGFTERRLVRDRLLKALISQLLIDDDLENRAQYYDVLARALPALDAAPRPDLSDLTNVDWTQLSPWLEPGQVPEGWVRRQ